MHHEQLDFSELDKMLGEAAKGPQKPAADDSDDSKSDGKDDTDK